MRRENLALGDVGGRERPAKPAVTKDRNTIGDASNLRKPMRDVDDRGAPRLDGFDSREKVLGFSRRQRSVGSSSTSTWGRCASAFAISTSCRSATPKSLTRVRLSKPAPTAASCSRSRRSRVPLGRRSPRHAVKKVLGDGEVRENEVC